MSAGCNGDDAREQWIERKEVCGPIARVVPILSDALIPERVPALPRRQELAPWLAAPDHQFLPVAVHDATRPPPQPSRASRCRARGRGRGTPERWLAYSGAARWRRGRHPGSPTAGRRHWLWPEPPGAGTQRERAARSAKRYSPCPRAG